MSKIKLMPLARKVLFHTLKFFLGLLTAYATIILYNVFIGSEDFLLSWTLIIIIIWPVYLIGSITLDKLKGKQNELSK